MNILAILAIVGCNVLMSCIVGWILAFITGFTMGVTGVWTSEDDSRSSIHHVSGKYYRWFRDKFGNLFGNLYASMVILLLWFVFWPVFYYKVITYSISGR